MKIDVERAAAISRLLYQEDIYHKGLVGFTPNTAEVQVQNEPFFETFNDYQVIDRNSTYPYEVYTFVNGIRFFCLCHEDPREVKDESASQVQNDESLEAKRSC